LINKSFSSSLFSTFSTNSSCSSSISVATIISSINVTVFSWSIMSQNKLFIIVWKIAEEFVNPKYITVGSYTPMYTVNTVFYSSPFLILILLYPYLRSSFINIFFFLLQLRYLQLKIVDIYSLLSTDLHDNSLVLFSSYYSLLQNKLVRSMISFPFLAQIPLSILLHGSMAFWWAFFWTLFSQILSFTSRIS